MTAMDEGGMMSVPREFPIRPVISEEAKALNRIADAIELLARATAGEFDQEGGEVEPAVDLSGRPMR